MRCRRGYQPSWWNFNHCFSHCFWFQHFLWSQGSKFTAFWGHFDDLGQSQPRSPSWSFKKKFLEKNHNNRRRRLEMKAILWFVLQVNFFQVNFKWTLMLHLISNADSECILSNQKQNNTDWPRNSMATMTLETFQWFFAPLMTIIKGIGIVRVRPISPWFLLK